ncbi:MAG TPA: cupredoxin domain-containing protein [Nitrososphaeraceae archaeon]|nr:cupredoxin domain-containing protein [Nitrososphaeraceae archaeon]
MRKLKNYLIFLIPLLLTTTLSTYVTLPGVAQLVNGSNATDKTSEQSEETSQTEKPFFFLFNTELPAFNVTEFPPDDFSLKILEVNQNDNVSIYFYNMESSTGDRHSFTINAPYNVNLNLGQGKNGSISFVANEPGIFRYYCEYHEPTMSGQLVVLPKG